jgi:hypothetical protein
MDYYWVKNKFCNGTNWMLIDLEQRKSKNILEFIKTKVSERLEWNVSVSEWNWWTFMGSFGQFLG